MISVPAELVIFASQMISAAGMKDRISYHICVGK